MRFFNTTGPVVATDHYCIPPLERLNIAEGLEQTAEYMDRCDAEAGHLVIFDRRADRLWSDKVFRDRRTSDSGVAIDIWGM